MTRTTDGGTMKSTSRLLARARRLALAAAAALAAVLLLAACGSSSSSSSSSSGSSSSGGLSKAASNPNATLIVNNAVPIATLDPNFTTNDQDPGFDGAMYSTLTQVDHEPGKVEGTDPAEPRRQRGQTVPRAVLRVQRRQQDADVPPAPGAEVPERRPGRRESGRVVAEPRDQGRRRRLLGARGNRLHAAADHLDQANRARSRS